MSKYIDIEDFSQMIYENFGRDGEFDYRDLIGILSEQPIADVKEVVRCKDCKWFDGKHIKHNDGHIEYVPEDYPFVENSVGINVQARCMRIPYIDNLFVKDSGMDYCSRAQRISESKYCKGDCSACEYFAYTGKCALKAGEE